jgi:hypothetical protein
MEQHTKIRTGHSAELQCAAEKNTISEICFLWTKKFGFRDDSELGPLRLVATGKLESNESGDHEKLVGQESEHVRLSHLYFPPSLSSSGSYSNIKSF